MSAAHIPPALHRFASTRPSTPSLNTVVCNASPSILMPSPPSFVSKHVKLKSFGMVHFRMPGFFRSNNSSSTSVNSHSKSVSQSSTPRRTATPVSVIPAPDVASATVHVPDTTTQVVAPAADIVEQIQDAPRTSMRNIPRLIRSIVTKLAIPRRDYCPRPSIQCVPCTGLTPYLINLCL